MKAIMGLTFKKSLNIFLPWFLVLVLVPNLAAEEDAGSVPNYHNNPRVAIVGHRDIRLDDLKNPQIQEMMQRLHSMQTILLKQKAIEILQEEHPEILNIRAPKIDREDIMRMYKEEMGLEDLEGVNTAALDNMILNYVEKLRRDAYLKELEDRYQFAVKQGWVQDFFEPPNDFKLVAGVGTAMLWFKPNARQPRKVFLMEFSDFLCPFCKKVQKTLNKLRERYGDKVQFGYRHFPLHKEAFAIAEAVECAREQDRFWEYQTRVYRDPQAFKSLDVRLKTAREVGIENMNAFKACLEDGRYRDRVQGDFRNGIELGIQGTPTFIIGTYNFAESTIHGEMFSGAVSSDHFVQTIEKYINLSKD